MAFNQALCGLYAAGHGLAGRAPAPAVACGPTLRRHPRQRPPGTPSDEAIRELGLLFADVLEKGMHLYGGVPAVAGEPAYQAPAPEPAPVPQPAAAPPALEPVVISGAALGLPGAEQTFDDDNVARILAGQNFITSLLRTSASDWPTCASPGWSRTPAGGGSFATIDDPADVIKLAGGTRPVDVVEQFGVDKARDEALDNTTRLAIGAGFDAMRDAGIPLVMSYKTTTLGTQLPDRWGLPEALRDETGVIFAVGLPRLRPLRRGRRGLRARPRPPRGPAGRRGAARPDERRRPGRGRGRRAHRRAARDPAARALPVRPALPLPGPVDGALPVRRDHRRARPEHPDQRGVREHHPGAVPGRGLDPRRPLPPGRRRLRATTPPASTCCRGSPPASSRPGPPPPTSASRTPPPPSTGAATA